MGKKAYGFILLMLLLAVSALLAMSRLQSSIPVAAGSITFVQTPESGIFPIGRLSLSATAPFAVCQLEFPRRVGSGGIGCWQSTVGFDGIAKTMTVGQTQRLHKYLDVTYQGNSGSLPSQWQNVFVLEFRKGFLNFSFAPENVKVVRIDAKQDLSIELFNDFVAIDGGFLVRRTTEKLYENNPSITHSQKFMKGRNVYKIAYETSQLGQTCFEVLPYAEVGLSREKLFPTEPKAFCYNVVPNIQEFLSTSTKCSSSEDCRSGFSCQKALPDSDVTLCMRAAGGTAGQQSPVEIKGGNSLIILLVFTALLGSAAWLVFRKGGKIGKG